MLILARHLPKPAATSHHNLIPQDFAMPSPSVSAATQGMSECTKLRYSPCPDWFPAWRLGIHIGRLRLLFLDERQSLSEYIPSLRLGTRWHKPLGFFLVPIRPMTNDQWLLGNISCPEKVRPFPKIANRPYEDEFHHEPGTIPGTIIIDADAPPPIIFLIDYNQPISSWTNSNSRGMYFISWYWIYFLGRRTRFRQSRHITTIG